METVVRIVIVLDVDVQDVAGEVSDEKPATRENSHDHAPALELEFLVTVRLRSVFDSGEEHGEDDGEDD
jgi:hypothetical protein